MEILQKDDGKEGMFYIEQDHKLLAELTYEWSGNKIIINHTGVREELEGQGIGKKLVLKSVDWARANKIKILPICPFAKRVMENSDEYKDVLF